MNRSYLNRALYFLILYRFFLSEIFAQFYFSLQEYSANMSSIQFADCVTYGDTVSNSLCSSPKNSITHNDINNEKKEIVKNGNLPDSKVKKNDEGVEEREKEGEGEGEGEEEGEGQGNDDEDDDDEDDDDYDNNRKENNDEGDEESEIDEGSDEGSDEANNGVSHRKHGGSKVSSYHTHVEDYFNFMVICILFNISYFSFLFFWLRLLKISFQDQYIYYL